MSTKPHSLEELLFGQTRGRVLDLFYRDTGRVFFGREIARLTGTSAGTINRELNTLTNVGLVNKATTGRQVLYRANDLHPVFNDLKSLLQKTSGVHRLLRTALMPLAGQIDWAFVYGSTARGDSLPGSDIDVMLVGHIMLDDVLKKFAPLESTLGSPINPTVFSLTEFQDKLQKRNHFLSAVMRGKKIMLVGDENELGQVGGVRLASR